MLRGRNDTVIPAASFPQREWEGLIFGALRVLHFPENPRYRCLPGAFESLRTVPGSDGLKLDVQPAGAALTIADGLIPVFYDGEGTFSTAPAPSTP